MSSKAFGDISIWLSTIVMLDCGGSSGGRSPLPVKLPLGKIRL